MPSLAGSFSIALRIAREAHCTTASRLSNYRDRVSQLAGINVCNDCEVSTTACDFMGSRSAAGVRRHAGRRGAGCVARPLTPLQEDVLFGVHAGWACPSVSDLRAEPPGRETASGGLLWARRTPHPACHYRRLAAPTTRCLVSAISQLTVCLGSRPAKPPLSNTTVSRETADCIKPLLHGRRRPGWATLLRPTPSRRSVGRSQRFLPAPPHTTRVACRSRNGLRPNDSRWSKPLLCNRSTRVSRR